MTNEIAVAQETQVSADFDYKAKALEWLQNMGTQLPPQQATQFLELCQCYKLNPFKREIYAVGYGNKFNIIVGYEVYLKRAERTGLLNGWHCETNENGTKAKVTIYRKDWQHPFVHEVLLEEVRQNSPIWQKMQTFMMKKVCIEQGFRLCFPDDMGGMPYGEEEVPYDRVIQQNETPIEAEEVEQKEQPKIAPSEDRRKLQKIVDYYGNQMDSGPYEMCCAALAGTDEAEVKNKLDRAIAYLGKKGIKVAA